MSGTITRFRAPAVFFTAFAMTVAGVFFTAAPWAAAAPAPIQRPPATTVTADRLPTVQIDGVVWSQAVVGNTVYAGGRFNNARPAGAAPGTNLTPRGNLLAYDITTGNLVTSFAPEPQRAGAVGRRLARRLADLRRSGDFTTAERSGAAAGRRLQHRDRCS